jgi:tetratricopeptide (TPR) repeat protein
MVAPPSGRFCQGTFRNHICHMSSAQNLLGGRYQFIQALNTHPSGRTFLAADVHYPGHPKCVVRELRLPTRNPMTRQFILRLLKQKVAVLEEIGQHPQVPDTSAAFDVDQSFFIVQEFIPGQSLLDLLAASGPWTVNEAIAFLQEVLPVLHFAQDHGVIHGNLKPSKLIRHHVDNKWVVLDFGSIKNISQHIAGKQKGQNGHNENGRQRGQSVYVAPEQYQQQTLFCSDHYALGMIVIQAMTGRHPEELPQVQAANRHEQLTAMLRGVPKIPPAFANLLMRMVHAHPQRRYQKAAEILNDLEDLLEASQTLALPTENAVTAPSTPPAVAVKATDPPPARSRRAWMRPVLGMLGLVTLVGLAAVFGLKVPQRLAAQRHMTQAEAIAAENPEGAIAAYSQALEQVPQQPEALAARSQLYFEQGDVQAALADISEAIDQAPDNPDYNYSRGNFRFTLGDIQGAINDYTQAIELKPTFTKAYVNRGSARADWGDDRGAVDDYSQAIELATDTDTEAAAYLNRCLSYSNLDEQELALSDCSAAINQRPSHALAYQNRGLVRRRLGDLQGSLQDYNIAIQIDPNSPDPFYNRALTRQALNDRPGAMEDLSQAIAIDPTYVFARYDRALLHIDMNNTSAALQDLRAASQLCLDLGRTGCYEDAQFQIAQLQNAAAAEGEATAPE